MTEKMDAFARQFDVSRETLDRLQVYEAVLRKWNPAINLVSPHTIDEIWQRHFADSAQIYRLEGQNKFRSWVDLGSGGGFPGLVVAVLAHENGCDCAVSLVESDKRKAAFLLEAARQMGLSVTVHSERIEKLPPLGADIVSARALAPLEKLLSYAQLHLAPGGTGLFLKGDSWKEELSLAQKSWSFVYDVTESLSHSAGAVITIKELQRV